MIFCRTSARNSTATMYENFLLFVLLLLLVWVSIALRKLTFAGGMAGGVIAASLFSGVGWPGIILLAIFFVLGTCATSWKSGLKQHAGLAEKRDGQRDCYQVMANGGVAGLLAIAAVLWPAERSFLFLLIASSLSAAIADTLSSELGSLYGKRFFNIITLRNDTRGENGVISVAGLGIGIFGSSIIAGAYMLMVDDGWKNPLIIIAAGTMGNLTDSILGATLERKGILRNDAVNLANTMAGALTAASITLF
jgi:uncharacterized protein (TIGR00297 family)